MPVHAAQNISSTHPNPLCKEQVETKNGKINGKIRPGLQSFEKMLLSRQKSTSFDIDYF